MIDLPDRADPYDKSRLRDKKMQGKEQLEERRKGDSEFIKVYPPGWAKLRSLIDAYPLAAKMYAFLAEHIDGVGAVVVSQALLAQKLGVSERTIRRLSTYLEDHRAIIRIKLQGNLYAYALNPNEVWKSWKDHKDYAAFTTRTLASYKDNPNINRRIRLMLTNQPPLPGLESKKQDDQESQVEDIPPGS